MKSDYSFQKSENKLEDQCCRINQNIRTDLFGAG